MSQHTGLKVSDEHYCNHIYSFSCLLFHFESSSSSLYSTPSTFSSHVTRLIDRNVGLLPSRPLSSLPSPLSSLVIGTHLLPLEVSMHHSRGTSGLPCVAFLCGSHTQDDKCAEELETLDLHSIISSSSKTTSGE